MKKNLTIIIPFCNEGDRLRRTIRNLTLTSSGMAQFIIVNDCSDDGIDYHELLHEYTGKYIMLHTKEPSGCGAARDIGMQHCTTPYFLLMDAHMGFPVMYADWYKKITALCRKYPNDLLTMRTMGLTEEGKVRACYQHSIGLKWMPAKKDSIYNVLCGTWMRDYDWAAGQCAMQIPMADMALPSNIMPTPIVMGAAYAGSVAQWERLHGLRGLRGYGFDEQFISLKYWCSGNRCLCITDLAAAHIYQVPHKRNYCDYLLQSVRVIKILFNHEQQKRLLERFFGYFPDMQKVVEQADWSMEEEENLYLRSCFMDGYEKYLDNVVKILIGTENENSSK